MKPIITTPRGSVIVTPNGTASLVWNTSFVPKKTKKFNEIQIFVDSEVLRLSEPYTPLLTGALVKTGDLGTVPGEGVVSWIAPYARKRYFTPRKSPSKTGPLRGPFWFERMREVHKKDILSGAQKIADKQ